MSKSRETRATDQGRILDDAARSRRQKKALEALELDNYHEEPHADLVMSKKAPKFQESLDGTKKKKRQRTDEYFKSKYRKNLSQLIQEDFISKPQGPNYSMAEASESIYPRRNFCSVCGYFSYYTCVQCGSRFCSIKCQATHKDTRCLKYTA